MLHLRQDRGVALLMVMVCLCIGVVLASIALTTTDTVVTIGDNAVTATESKWAAESEVGLAVAVLQTKVDWTDGDRVLFADRAIPGGFVHVKVTDLDGNVPDDDDVDVIVTAEASVHGVKSSCSKMVRLTPDAAVGDAFDPWLREFAAFATTELEIESGSTLSQWAKSPRAKRATPVKLGIGFGSSAGFKIDNGTRVTSAEVYSDSTSSAALRSLVSSQRLGRGTTLQLPLPKVAETLPSDFGLLMLRTFFPLTYSGSATSVALPSGTYQAVTLDKSATMTLNGGSGVYWSFGDTTLLDKSVLRLSGDVRLQVRGALKVSEKATVVLADENSKLTLYLMNDMTVDDACVGVEASVSRLASRTASSISTYSAPTRIHIIGVSSLSGAKAQPVYFIDNGALVCVSIHAPTARVTVDDKSTLVGRASTAYFSLQGQSELVADPALDSGVGFTNLNGPLYKTEGVPLDGLVQAIKGYNVLSGVTGLVSVISATIAPAPEPTAEAGVTPRDASRVQQAPVARTAFELEGKSGAMTSAEASVESVSEEP